MRRENKALHTFFFATAEMSAQVPYRMAFVVNNGLKMGAGKIAAQVRLYFAELCYVFYMMQVGHATLALYEHAQRTPGGPEAVTQWRQRDNECKIVLKVANSEELQRLEWKAKEVI